MSSSQPQHYWSYSLASGQAVIKSAASAASLGTRKIQIILPENPMPFWYWSYSLAQNFFDTSHATSARHQRINVQLPRLCEMHSWPCRLVWRPGGQAVIKSAASAASLETRKIQIILEKIVENEGKITFLVLLYRKSGFDPKVKSPQMGLPIAPRQCLQRPTLFRNIWPR